MCSNCSDDAYREVIDADARAGRREEAEALEAAEKLGILHPQDRESTEEEVELAFSLEAKRERAMECIRKAAADQSEGGFLGRQLRDRGILP